MITVVSGLPRSGTSMMMQMLRAGGLAVLADAARPADDSNPRGYLEDTRVKRVMQDAAWLGEADGKAVKIVAPLLSYLPPGHDYRVVFMERDLDEVLASQAAMLARAGQTGADPAVLRRAFYAQLERVKAWLAAQPNVQTCYVPYRAVVATPQLEAERVAAFLDAGLDAAGLDAAAMARAVDPSLYRERG